MIREILYIIIDCARLNNISHTHTHYNYHMIIININQFTYHIIIYV